MSVPPSKQCPDCGRITGLAARFCEQCGHTYRTQFSQAAPPQPAGGTPSPIPIPRPGALRRDILTLCAVLFLCYAAYVFYGVITPVFQPARSTAGGAQSSAGDSADSAPVADTGASALEMGRRIQPYAWGTDTVRRAYGDPDKIQSFNHDGVRNEVWYYDRRGGEVQITFYGSFGQVTSVNVW